jgi:hypothetical protein
MASEWAFISLEDGCGLNVDFVRIIKVDLILIVDCSVSGIGKFASTE